MQSGLRHHQQASWHHRDGVTNADHFITSSARRKALGLKEGDNQLTDKKRFVEHHSSMIPLGC